MSPPKPRDIQQRTNIEQSIAKTQTDINKMKAELRDMNNSTSAYDGISPNLEEVAKLKADIARAEKHLAELNAVKNGRTNDAGSSISPDILVGSFRSEMDALMKLDDATFQKNFTEVQYRNARGESPARQHKVEMYEAAANVRKHSDTSIITNAENIINGNREFLGSRHPNRGPSNLSRNEKAFLVAENAALRSRLKDIVSTKLSPAIAQAVEDAAISGKPAPLAEVLEREKGNRKLWPLLLLLLPLIWALSKCTGDNDKTLPPP